MRDTFYKMMGRTRYVVCRLFLHLSGRELAPLLKFLNRTVQEAIDSEGDMQILGEGLVEICQTLLQYDEYWLSAANEGDVFWNEGEAGDYVNELFTDSAARYLSGSDFSSTFEFVSEALTPNLIVMITVAYEGEVADLETDLSNISALRAGFKTLINLYYKHTLRAIQVHFSPAKLGDKLTNEQVLKYYPELIPLLPNSNQPVEISQPSTFTPAATDNITLTSDTQPKYDVFLAHNSLDKPLVREIAKQLKQRGLKPWLDEEAILAGQIIQEEIQKIIPQIKAAAFFIGQHGLGKWQKVELRSLYTQCVEKGITVIPVLLPDVREFPPELVFLKEHKWVSFSEEIIYNPLDSLYWGIIQSKPEDK